MQPIGKVPSLYDVCRVSIVNAVVEEGYEPEEKYEMLPLPRKMKEELLDYALLTRHELYRKTDDHEMGRMMEHLVVHYRVRYI